MSPSLVTDGARPICSFSVKIKLIDFVSENRFSGPTQNLASLFTTMYSSRFYPCPSTISYDGYGFDAPPLRKIMQSIFNIHKPTLSIPALSARLICLVQQQAVQAILSL